jgi:hypothetical protein
MSLTRFKEVLSSLDFSLPEFVELIRSRVQELWKPSTHLSLDESMAPFQGRMNPHHLFVPRKPHPHGLKFYTLADASGDVLNLALHKRTAEDQGELHDPLLFSSKRGEWERGEKTSLQEGPGCGPHLHPLPVPRPPPGIGLILWVP